MPFVLVRDSDKAIRQRKRNRIRALVIAVVCLTASIVLGVALFLANDLFRTQTQDTTKPTPVMTLGISTSNDVAQGGTATLRIDLKNNFPHPVNTIVKIAAKGLDFTSSISTANGLETINQNEITQIDPTLVDATGVVWRPGEIKVNGKQTLVINAKVSGTVGDKAIVKGVAFQALAGGRRCGIFWYKQCDVQVKETALARGDTLVLITPTDNSRNALVLGKGYNLVTLPLTISQEGLDIFWQQFTDPKAWRLDGATNTWLDITQKAQSGTVKPGNGFWLYHPDGGEIKLPPGEPPSINDKVDIKLTVGWNQIGNPFDKRIQMNGDQIIISRNGQENLSLTGAMEAGAVKNILGVSGAVADISNLNGAGYYPFVPGRYLPAYAGLFVETGEALTMTLSGKLLVAPGELLSATEKAKILGWINKNALDICGNQPSNNAGGNPLFLSDTGEVLDQYDCIMLRHPDRPWNQP